VTGAREGALDVFAIGGDSHHDEATSFFGVPELLANLPTFGREDFDLLGVVEEDVLDADETFVDGSRDLVAFLEIVDFVLRRNVGEVVFDGIEDLDPLLSDGSDGDLSRLSL
jgi:hypothetical protein